MFQVLFCVSFLFFHKELPRACLYIRLALCVCMCVQTINANLGNV